MLLMSLKVNRPKTEHTKSDNTATWELARATKAVGDKSNESALFPIQHQHKFFGITVGRELTRIPNLHRRANFENTGSRTSVV
jgi:hypothetical protein